MSQESISPDIERDRLNVTRHNGDYTPPWTRLFARLPATTRPGDIVTLPDTPYRWRVETAKVADDGRDAKCVVSFHAR